jgi:DNA helicase-2/ATP-dependent DNA helicase PcrA
MIYEGDRSVVAESAQTQINQRLINLADGIRQLRASLRPGQQRMADWTGGPLAVSAVPGSGKSTGMAIATAILLAKRYLHISHQPTPTAQLVLVTFTRSAAANLKNKIRGYLQQLGLTSQGFAVYTLHGLALNIATRHPELAGFQLDRMTLVTPNQNSRLLRTAVEQWIAANPHLFQRLLEGQQFDGEETERLRRQSVLRTEVLPELAHTVIREAKSSGIMPPDLMRLGQTLSAETTTDEVNYDILAIAAGLYENYQRLLLQRSLIDYDDMILAALRVLQNDAARTLWRSQVLGLFEDEAQDSSPLQTQLLEILAADPIDDSLPLNLVRVGDPNQAINSTFTPADPLYFRRFCEACRLHNRLAEMDQAGRSSPIIMEAANFLLIWVNRRYGNPSSPQYSLELPFRPQVIHPVSPNDPQLNANPAPTGSGLEIRYPRDIFHTVELISRRVSELFSQTPDARAAVLVRENRQGKFVADLLRHPTQYGLEVDLGQQGIEVYEVGQRDRYSYIPIEILTLLQFCDRPHSPDYLKAALGVLVQRQLIPTQDLNRLSAVPEQFLYPDPLTPPQPAPELQAQHYCTALLNARQELPQSQLIPFLAMVLRYDPTELASTEKLAARLAQQTAGSPTLNSTLELLGEIVQSEQFEPVETEDPETRYIRSGQLTIITMHKAKGLDWDYVFIPFLHEQTIPGQSWVPPQTQFLGDFNVAEVARAQIRHAVHGTLKESAVPLNLQSAWEQARNLKLAEEFRLLYVAMTRAKSLLWMSAAQKAPFTWNKPDNFEDKLPCPVLPALNSKFPDATKM